MKKTKAQYLADRGWNEADEGAGWWIDPNNHTTDVHGVTQVSTDAALVTQLARDAAESRKCIADAIANAAARHSKSAGNVTDEQKRDGVMLAAVLARDAFRECFGVEIVDEATS